MYIISTRYVTFLLSHTNSAIVATFLPQEYHIEHERSLPTFLPMTDDYEQEQNWATVRCYEGWISVVFCIVVWELTVLMLWCLFVFRACHCCWFYVLLLNTTIEFYVGGWVMDERACMI